MGGKARGGSAVLFSFEELFGGQSGSGSATAERDLYASSDVMVSKLIIFRNTLL